MKNIFARHWLIAILIFLSVCSSAWLSISDTSFWGDDGAAYIMEGIALYNGTIDEQAEDNYKMRGQTRPEEDVNQAIYYVWEYPLLLSVVYHFVGFDRADYHTISFYKVPCILVLGFIAMFFYLFLQKRFSNGISVAGALLLGCSFEFIDYINYMYGTDLILTLWFVILLFLMDYYGGKSKVRSIPVDMLIGIVLWLAVEIRLNGKIVVAFFALWQVKNIIIDLKKNKRLFHKFYYWINLVVPYLTCFILVFTSEKILFTPTKTTSDFNISTIKIFLENLVYYGAKGIAVLGTMFVPIRKLVGSDYIMIAFGFVPTLLCFYGMLKHVRDDTYVLLGILTISVIGTSCLPYHQNFRYLYYILPIIVLYICYGFKEIFSNIVVQRQMIKSNRIFKLLIPAFCLYLLTVGPFGTESQTEEGPYSDEAVEMWNYIQDNVSEDEITLTNAARYFTLNTGRLGISNNGKYDVDYILNIHEISSNDIEEDSSVELVFENTKMALYKVLNEE